MKRLSIFIFIMLFAMVNAQKSIDIQARFLENTKYAAGAKYDMIMELPNGENPIAMNMGIKMDFKTGKKSGDKIPLVIDLNTMDFKINGNLIPLSFDGVKMYGYTQKGTKIRIDSISGKTLNNEMKKQLKKTFDQMKQYDYNGKIKVGESKTLSMPINMDGDEVVAKVTYTLERIENNHGILNLKGIIPEFTNKEGLKTTIDIDGKLFYNIQNLFYDRNDINMKMKMTKGNQVINARVKFDILVDVLK
uniref:hypothetical protein n=1 Tax=Ornithobacterium rhinotracheale TaxID=28251 RepID=UPI00129C8B64|nr:hypothetical protein [Ornithobacterium rhinotracheale]